MHKPLNFPPDKTPNSEQRFPLDAPDDQERKRPAGHRRRLRARRPAAGPGLRPQGLPGRSARHQSPSASPWSTPAGCPSTKTTPTHLLAEARSKPACIKATTDPTVLEDAAAIIVTIGTPVDEYLDPSVGEFDRSIDRAAAARSGPGSCWSCAAPSFPGMTDRLARQLEQHGPRRRGPGLLPRAHRAGPIAGRAGAIAAAGRRHHAAGRRAGRRPVPADLPEGASSSGRSRRSWPSCSATPGATSTSPSPTSST